MELNTLTITHLKNVFAHNVAQIFTYDKAAIKDYLIEIEETLREQNFSEEDIFEIVFYAKRKGRVESKILKDMYERYGIKPQVAGYGGSSISIETLIELAITKYE